MATRRTVRVAEVIRHELAGLMTRANDFEGILVTISSIEIAPDLKHAYVYVSVLDPDRDLTFILRQLNKHKSQWQRVIAQRMATKITPRLHFRFDTALERGDRVMELLHEIEEEQKTKNPSTKQK